MPNYIIYVGGNEMVSEHMAETIFNLMWNEMRFLVGISTNQIAGNIRVTGSYKKKIYVSKCVPEGCHCRL